MRCNSTSVSNKAREEPLRKHNTPQQHSLLPPRELSMPITERTDTRFRSTRSSSIHHARLNSQSLPWNDCHLPPLSAHHQREVLHWNFAETWERRKPDRHPRESGIRAGRSFPGGEGSESEGEEVQCARPRRQFLAEAGGGAGCSVRDERRGEETKQSWPKATDQQPLDAGRPFAKGRHKCATHAAKEKAQKAPGYDKDGRQGDR